MAVIWPQTLSHFVMEGKLAGETKLGLVYSVKLRLGCFKGDNGWRGGHGISLNNN